MTHSKLTLRSLKLAPVLIAAGLLAPAGHAQEAAPASPPPPASAPERIAIGATLYQRIGCAACHGGVGQGGSAGPALIVNPLPFDAFDQQVRDPINAMPAYTHKVLPDAELRAIYAFLGTLKP